MFEIPNHEIKIKTKEDILDELKSYKKVLSSELFDYLLSLVNINDSALREQLSNEEVSVLKNIPVYDDITLFNLYYLTKEYINIHPEVVLSEKSDDLELYTGENKKRRKIFELYYNQELTTRKQYINLYNEVNDQKYFDDLDEKISNELDYEYKKKNPYSYDENRYGGPASLWVFNHREKIERLKRELQNVRERNIPTKEENEEIKIMQEYNKSLMNYFGIKESGFKDFNEYAYIKILKKTINGVDVYNKIRHI